MNISVISQILANIVCDRTIKGVRIMKDEEEGLYLPYLHLDDEMRLVLNLCYRTQDLAVGCGRGLGLIVRDLRVVGVGPVAHPYECHEDGTTLTVGCKVSRIPNLLPVLDLHQGDGSRSKFGRVLKKSGLVKPSVCWP